MAITIDASGSDGIDFEAFVGGGFQEDVTGGGSPSFNESPFSGEEMFISYGGDAASKYVLAQGDITYSFIPAHTVYGTIDTIEYGVRGTGSFDADGKFVGGDVALRITGLDLFNALDPEAEVEAEGPVHNFAIAAMAGANPDPTAAAVYADALDAQAQIFIGSAGRDIYSGTSFGDTVSGNVGNDTLDGGIGDDSVSGGGTRDSLTGGVGNDTLDGGDGLDQLDGGHGNDALLGGSAGDSLVGGVGADSLAGEFGADALQGGYGRDSLDGGAANDTLDGGEGVDLLTGGSGSDSFVFAPASNLASLRDTIADFAGGSDLIDLSALAGEIAGGGGFQFIGADAFGGVAGEIRTHARAGTTLVQVDLDGDANLDFAITLANGAGIGAGDFIL